MRKGIQFEFHPIFSQKCENSSDRTLFKGTVIQDNCSHVTSSTVNMLQGTAYLIVIREIEGQPTFPRTPATWRNKNTRLPLPTALRVKLHHATCILQLISQASALVSVVLQVAREIPPCNRAFSSDCCHLTSNLTLGISKLRSCAQHYRSGT